VECNRHGRVLTFVFPALVGKNGKAHSMSGSIARRAKSLEIQRDICFMGVESSVRKDVVKHETSWWQGIVKVCASYLSDSNAKVCQEHG
jgi:hypothetical protein